MTSSEPKTKKELALEKLREIDSRLTVVKRMLGSSPEDVKGKLERASKKMKDAKGEARFVRAGACMVEGTDRLEALLAMEESYTDMLDLQGKDPPAECIAVVWVASTLAWVEEAAVGAEEAAAEEAAAEEGAAAAEEGAAAEGAAAEEGAAAAAEDPVDEAVGAAAAAAQSAAGLGGETKAACTDKLACKPLEVCWEGTAKTEMSNVRVENAKKSYL